MPWTPGDADEHVHGLIADEKRQWADIANGVRRKCLDNGGSEQVCDAKAIRVANSQVAGKAAAMYEFRQWTAQYADNLPDGAFLHVESGGEKGDEGKTTPRALRHLPYKDEDGEVDLPHLRSALSRLGQGKTGEAKDGWLTESLRAKLETKAKGILKSEKDKRGMAVLATGGPMEMASSVMDVDGYPVQRFRKELIRVGTYTHPTQGWTLKVTPDRMLRWVRNFKRMREAGVEVNVNRDHKHGAEFRHGDIVDMWVEGDRRVIGSLELRGEDSIDLAKKNRSVSVEIDRKFKDGIGNEYDEAIVGVAITGQPVVPGQTPFVPIAASMGAGKLERDAPLYMLGDEPMSDETLKRYAKLLGMEIDAVKELKEDALAEKVEAALKARDDKLAAKDEEIEALQASKGEDGKPKAGDEDRGEDPKPDPDALSMLADGADEKLESLVRMGRITPACRDELKPILLGDGEQYAVRMLSRRASEGKPPLTKRLLAALEKNDPVQLKEQTGPQGVALSRDVPGGDAGADVDEELQSEMVEMAGGKANV